MPESERPDLGEDNHISMDMETAQAEFDRLCESWNLAREYDAEDKEGAKSIVRYIHKGVLAVKEGKGDKLVLEHKLHEPISKDGGVQKLVYKYIITEDIMGLDNIDSGKTLAQGVELIHAMSGMQTQLHVIANESGDYAGFSANYSGDGFAGMKFTARVTSKATFNRWVGEVKKSSRRLTLPVYKQLALNSKNNPATYFASVKPRLFKFIIMKYNYKSTGKKRS